MIGVGLKVHVFIEIIGFIFFILAVLLLAWSSYIMLAMSIGLMMAKKEQKDRAQLLNPRTGRWVKIDTKKGGIVHSKKSKGPFKNVKKVDRRKR
jgi:hypothetical protein